MRPVTLQTGFTRGDFDALLASRQFAYAEAFTLRLTSGSVLAYTDAQKSFTVPPCDGSVMLQTYVANDVLIDGLRFKISSGGENQGGDPTTSIVVDEQSVTLYPNGNPASPSEIDGVPFLTAVGRGALDGAVLQRDRWFFESASNTPVGGFPIFYGYTASIDQLSRTQAIVKVKSDLVLLNIQMPRNLYQPNCQYTVYSTGCGVNKAAHATAGVVGASPTRSFIPWSSATAQFTLGEVTFETGPNVGLTRSIRTANTSGLTLAYPLPYTPIAGDQFQAYPGCDRAYAGGCAYFSNQSRFRATPYVPQAEMAL